MTLFVRKKFPIFVRLAGGLGNQLFQVAAATLVSNRLRQDIFLVANGLSNYNVSRELMFQHILRPQTSHWRYTSPGAIATFLADRFRLGRLPVPAMSINDSNILNSLSPCFLRLPCFMDGYFQQFWTAELFFESLSYLNIASSLGGSAVSDDVNWVSVHVRGGDFLSESRYLIADFDFYLRCFELAVGQGFRRFMIVTDDKSYAQSILLYLSDAFPGIMIEVAPPSSALDDFYRIRNAPARIIGNSTFAWWASALSLSGPTWSSPSFVAGSPKPFLLPSEIYVF